MLLLLPNSSFCFTVLNINCCQCIVQKCLFSPHFNISYQIAKEIRQDDLLKENSPSTLLGQDKLRYEPVESLLDDRISFQDSEKVPRAVLIINATTLDDRGRYNCTARNKATETSPRFQVSERGCYVRIKGTNGSDFEKFKFFFPCSVIF